MRRFPDFLDATARPLTGTTNYTLDALYRLTQVDAPDAANDEAFSYDRLGNRLIHTRGSATVVAAGAGIVSKYSIYTTATQTGSVSSYTPGYNNRLKEIRIGSATGAIDSSFAFDHEGRMTGQTGSNARTLTWDAKSRLKALSQSGSTETYSYDPMNHRIRRSGGSLGTLDYYLEGEHLESVEQLGTLTEKYFRGSTVDELVAGYTTQTGKLTPFFFQHDQVMSVAAETKPNGGTQAALSYFAFGENQAATGTTISRLKYTGREEEPSGLYFYRARYYDPKSAIFVSEDPLRFGAGPNFYAYVGNNPVNANDPSGLMPDSLAGWFEAGKSAVGVVANTATTIAGGALIGGGSAVAAVPTGVNQVIGYGGIALGSTLVGKGVGGVALNATNFMDAWNNKPASMPTSLPRLIAEGYAPGNQAAIAAADAIDLVTDLAALKVPVGGYYNSVGTFVRQNSMEISNWGAASKSIENLQFLTVAAPGTSLGTAANVLGTFASGVSNGLDWVAGTACTTCSGAAGGFLLYPNKSNTNQMQSVYRK